MPRLEDLKTDLLKMTPDEIRANIRKIRADRIIRKGKAKVVKAERVKTSNKVDALIAQLSPAEIAKLMEELGE